MPDRMGGASASHARWNPTPLGVFLLLMFVLPVLPTFPRHAIGALAGDGKYFAAGLLAVVGALWVLPAVPLKAFKISGALLFLYYFLLAFALLVDVDRVIVRDALELYKPAVAAGSFLMGLGIVFRRPEVIPVVWRGLVALLLLIGAVGLIEVVAPGWLGVAAAYKRDSAVLVRKPITFFHTTYFAASVYLLIGSMFTARAILSRRFLPNVLLAVAAFVLVILTQSRGAALALMIVLAWAGILLSVISISDTWTTLRRVVAIGVISGTLITLGTLYALENLPYLTTGLQRYVLHWQENLTGGGSLAARARQIAWAVEHNHLVVVGAGIGKAYNPLLESWYALYYYRYGLAGMLLYVGVWGGYFLYSLRWLRRVRLTLDGEAGSFVVGLNIFLVGLPVVSFSSVITDQIFLIPFYYGLLGVGVGIIATAKSLGAVDPGSGVDSPDAASSAGPADAAGSGGVGDRPLGAGS